MTPARQAEPNEPTPGAATSLTGGEDRRQREPKGYTEQQQRPPEASHPPNYDKRSYEDPWTDGERWGSHRSTSVAFFSHLARRP
jgi:hypothetical protein